MRLLSTILFVILALLLIAGCGSAPSKGKYSTPARTGSGSSSSASPDKKGVGSKVQRIARAVTIKRQGSWNPSNDKVKAVRDLVAKAARENGLPEDLIFGIIWVESRFNPEAVSPVGARGLMQLMPKTADYLAEKIKWSGSHKSFDPEFNIAAGSYYIAKLIDQFDGDVELALAAYNAGPTKIRRWMKGDGLPKVSIEYHTMVQTARTFFGGSPGGSSGTTPAVLLADDDLDKLGLAILIAGLSEDEFGMERTDDADPFDEKL